MIKYFYNLLVVLFFCASADAQPTRVDWYGFLINASGVSPVVFHILRTNETYSSTIDIPAQGVKNVPADQTSRTENNLVITNGQLGIKYGGTYLSDTKISGTFTQGSTSLKLSLFNSEKDAIADQKASRPQMPKEFPYKQEEVTFINKKSGNELAGTLTIPKGGRIEKIVIMITGSGPQNRDEEIFNHSPFLIWSDWLTRQGIATLRYDDRGIAKSTGNYKMATTRDFADDVNAAINFIHSRSDLRSLSIGLMGHSEGGLVAAMVARENAAIKFLVLLAAPGIPMEELFIQQSSEQMILKGVSEEKVKKAMASRKEVYALIKESAHIPTGDLKERIDSNLRVELLQTLPENMIDFAVIQTEKVITTPWFRFAIALKPSDYLTHVHCPVLAINGTLDKQVNYKNNLAGIKAALRKASNKNHQEVELNGLNHLFQKAKSGSTEEYGSIRETVNKAALEKVANWLLNLK